MMEQVRRCRWGPIALAAVFLAALPVRSEEFLVGAAEAYKTIQSAIVAAQANDIVTVAPGTYNEAIDFLGKEITVRSKGDRNITIIDATGLTKVSVVSFKTGETAKSVLEGFTITAGSGTPLTPTSPITQGGGIYIASLASPATPSTPVIRNCLIKANNASQGGGILLKSADVAATIEDCEISGNVATTAGGGINAAMTGTKAAPLSIKGTTFKDNLVKNSGAAYGGGAYLTGANASALVTLTDCTFTGNVVGSSLTAPITSGGDGGGLYLDTVPVVIDGGKVSENTALNGGGLTLKNQGTKSSIRGTKDKLLLVESNTAQAGGGGGGLYLPGAPNSTNLLLSYTRIADNTSGSQGGGAILVAQGSLSFESCELVNNFTTQDGGAIRYLATGVKAKVNATLFAKNKASTSGGAIYVSSSSSVPVTYTNCVFFENQSSGDGGAIYCKAPAGAIVKFLYSTFYKNAAGPTATFVGGIKFDSGGGTALVYNTILWDNTPLDYDSTHSAASQIDYCDVGKPATFGRASMLNLDPGFVDVTSDPPDLHLKVGSAILGLGKAGTDADLRAVTKDFEGKDRPPLTDPQDMGAFVGAPVEKVFFVRGHCRQKDAALDLTGAEIDITDAIFLLRWSFANPGNYAPGCQKACDADDTGKVDLNDAVYILNYLFHTPGPAPKAPFPAKGTDPNPDPLPCDDWKTLWP